MRRIIAWTNDDLIHSCVYESQVAPFTNMDYPITYT